MSSSREQLLQLAEAFRLETDQEKLLQLTEQLLEALNQVDADSNESMRVA